MAVIISGYRVVTSATRIPVPGGKLIEELFGHVNTGTGAFSLAHMIAPPGWGEPAQAPEFGELTIMVRGQMLVVVGGDRVELSQGQAIWVDPGQRVQYSNPYPVENEYFAVCMPAFSPAKVHRDEA